jgi:hypothetical protein
MATVVISVEAPASATKDRNWVLGDDASRLDWTLDSLVGFRP